MAICGTLALAAACGGDDDSVFPGPSKSGASGGAGKGGAGAGGTTGGSGGATGGSAGSKAGGAGSGGTAGGKGGAAGSGGSGGSTAGTGGKGGKGGKGGTGGTGGTGGSSIGGAGGEAGIGGEAGHGGSLSTGGTGGKAGNGGLGGLGGRAGQGGKGGSVAGGAAGIAGEGGVGGEGGSGGSGESALNLFFSEYVENNTGSPNAVEIVNKSGRSADLSGCSVRLYANAASAPTSTVGLTGSLADGDVFVICSAAIGNVCDQVAAGLVFDGNDAVALRCDGTDLDIIGRTTGTSPGTQWGNATVGTRNQTLRRDCSVTQGDRNGTNPFAPATEWTHFAVGTTSGLGSAACSG